MESISIIIPNYNGAALLSKNIPYVVKAASLYKERIKGEIEIIVIDDASSDKSLAFLAYLQEQYNTKIPIKVVVNERNLGFSRTVNKAVKESQGSLLVLLNTDVTPSEDFLLSLIPHFHNASVFAVGCLDKSIENGKIVERGRGIARWRRGLFIHSAGELNASTTAWVSGGSGMFRRTIWEKLRGFNELYSPYYWEDIDLSYRARKAGYTVLFDKSSIVTHRHEEGAIKSSTTKKHVAEIAYRNQFIFIWSNLTDGQQWVAHLCFLPWHIVKSLIKGDLLFLKGGVRALATVPEIFRQRHKYSMQREKTDSELQIFS